MVLSFLPSVFCCRAGSGYPSTVSPDGPKDWNQSCIILLKWSKSKTVITSHTCTHAHSAILGLSGLCLRQPKCVGTGRNIYPLTPIMAVNYPLSASSIFYDPWFLPVQFVCPTVFFHNVFQSFLWSISWSGTLHFILHTFLHPVINFCS